MNIKMAFCTVLSIIVMPSAWAGNLVRNPPTGNDNQGGVSAPGGTYSTTPNSGPVQVNAYTGNATRIVNDLSVTAIGEIGLNFTRFNNTRVTQGYQLMGVGANWRHSFQWDFAYTAGYTQLGHTYPATIQIVYPDGTFNTFTNTSTNLFTSTSAVSDIITPNANGYQLTNSKNEVFLFTPPTSGGSPAFVLSKITDSKGLVTTLSYTSLTYHQQAGNLTLNFLTKVTEPGGRYIQINYQQCTNENYNGTNCYLEYLGSVASSDGRTVSYSFGQTATYSGGRPGGSGLTAPYTLYSNYLSSVSYPDSTSATYTYGTFPHIPGSSANMVTANDTYAQGPSNITYTYWTTAAAAGTVETTGDGNGVTLNTVGLENTNNQTPITVYPDGTSYLYNVNAGGQVSTITNTLNYINSYAYTSGTGTWTATTTDSDGNSVATVALVNGKLASRVWPKVGSETIAPTEYWSYDAKNYLIVYTDVLGHTTTFTRDPSNELVTSIRYPDATTESFTYNSFAEVLSHTRRNGGIEYFTYDSTGLLLTKQDAVGNVTTFTYDSNSRVATVTDANNHTTSFLYNSRGLPTQVTNPDGTYRTSTYDNSGNLLTVTDELGHTTTYTYDDFNRVLTATDPLNRVTTYQYNASAPANSAPILVTYPNGKETATAYNAGWGYKAYQITTGYGTAQAATTSYGFDGSDNVTSVTDPLNHTTTIGYDARNRKAWAEDPAGNESFFYYDDGCNLLSQVTPDGTTANTYDTMNRLTQSNDPKNQIAKMSYDSEGQLQTYTDPNNNVYNYGCDLDERQLSMRYPDTSAESYTYDPVGNLATFTTRDARVQTLAYDNRNRNTGYSWNDGVTPAVSQGYDNASRLTGLSNANSALSYTYDNDNEVLTETQNVTGLGSKTISYGYNTDGTISSLTYPDGTALSYGYDGRNNVTSVLQGATTVVSYSYDAAGNRIGKNLANGVNSTLTYDAVERLTSILDVTPSPSAGTQLQRFDYGYDAMSRLKYVKRNSALGDVYSYDASGQLTNVQYNATNPDTTPTNPLRTVSYALDAAGNRTQVTDSVNGNTTYVPNSDNQYTTVGGNAATYDGRGNFATYNGWTYTYDAQNRLVQATNNLGANVTQAYDPLGRCVQRVQNGVTAYAVYDLGWNVLADFNSSGTQTNRYVGGVGTDEILTKTDSSNNVIYYHTDGLGSVTKLTDHVGNLVEQYSYDVYGEPTIENGSGNVLSASAYGNRFLFTGREYLASMDLYDYRSRAYSGNLGRFLQPDPIGHAGDSYNIHRYCGNDPVNNTDPFGQDPNGDPDYPPGSTPTDFGYYDASGNPVIVVGGYNPYSDVNSLLNAWSTAASNAAQQSASYVYNGLGNVAALTYLGASGIINNQFSAEQYRQATIVGFESGLNFVGQVAVGEIGGQIIGAGLKAGATAVQRLLAEVAEQATAEAQTVVNLAAAQARVFAGGLCFARGTLVSTPSGNTPIEDIKKGDTVYAYDFERKQTVKGKVLETYRHTTLEWDDVSFDDGELIHATPGHRFWVDSEHSWLEASKLQAGMTVLRENGRDLKVLGLSVRHLSSPETTYNFNVDDEHDYFVSKAHLLVHNACASFASPDPLVTQLANKIEAMYPGLVKGVNVPLTSALGNTDADILLQNAVIQVKSGRGAQNLFLQLQKSESATGLPAVGFGPNLPFNSLKTLSSQGALVTGDEATLLQLIKP